jgi:hypothetical protein
VCVKTAELLIVIVGGTYSYTGIQKVKMKGSVFEEATWINCFDV